MGPNDKEVHGEWDEEELLNDPDYVDLVIQAFELENNDNKDSEELDILREFGY